MVQATYRKTLTAARRDLKRYYRQREEMDRKIAKLRQTVVTLGALCSEGFNRDFAKEYGLTKTLTDAVFDAIIASERPLHPKEIQFLLEDLGYEFKSANRGASIHSVCKRLVQQGKLAPVVRISPKEGKGAYDKCGFWWGDQKPPAPWIRQDWGGYEAPKEEKSPKRRKNLKAGAEAKK
jgi:hypothetical protein